MLRLPRFRYVAPATLDEAIDVRMQHLDSSMYVAGGTDVYPKMKRRQFQPEVVIGLGSAVRDHISNGTGLLIGAGATLTTIAEHPKVRQGYTALAEAAALVSTPQLRNMGTIGGNVCLDTRCNWYDQSLFWRTAEGFCMKTHADVVCRVATSSPRCLAVASADTVPALIALGAALRVLGPSGERTIRLADCYREDGIRYLALEPGEIVIEIVLPPSDGWRSTYLKLRDRGSFDFPIAGVATAVRWDGGRVAEARIAITALASRPVAVDASVLVGTRLEDDAITAAADAVHKTARPMDNTSGTISQRKRASRVFAERALRSLRA
ncbi:MAG TPA: FAD binding domain-containing protein [Candidatus Acidoferrales bacterium]|nr:FAD binding domain-containing protein [Candidatus Acidoferrales bacterium]